MRYIVLYSAIFVITAAFSIYDKNLEPNGDLELSDSKSDTTDCRCFNGRCVTNSKGKKKCKCYPKHALTDEEHCQPCDCGSKGKCIFVMERQSDGSIHYTKKCVCDKGSAEKDRKCVDCHCGLNSKCEFEGDEKICYCEDGYSEKEGVCTECNCGEYGDCKHESDRKVCSCFPGYLVNGERCEECDCGEYGACTFHNGEKKCQCHKGYRDNEGYCEECDCGLNSLDCRFELGLKRCDCKYGNAQTKGTCQVCGCGDHSHGCHFEDEAKVCKCENGYVQKGELCVEGCGVLHDCKNGGGCEGGFCNCNPGTKGEFCEEVEGCDHLCEDVRYARCAYDVVRLKAVCLCQDSGFRFDPETRICKAPCSYDDDCMNGASCEGVDTDTFCRCRPGTRGDFCEIVSECKEDPDFCGRKNDSLCVYDTDSFRAICKCHVDGKMFDTSLKMCRIPCDPLKEEPCENGGICRSNGGNSFCMCHKGTSGNMCEIVDDCHADPDFCGKGNSDRCVYDRRLLKADCKCDNELEKFDFSKKICRTPCNLDNSFCNNGAKCEGSGTAKFCKCQEGTRGDRCEVIDQCKEDPNFCGEKDDVECVYDVLHSQAVCKCKEIGKKFDGIDKMCKNPCSYKDACMNGANCEGADADKFCRCMTGTRGDFCEIVHKCREDPGFCGEANDARCVYDTDSVQAICKCHVDGKMFDESLKMCRNPCDPSKEEPCQNGAICKTNGENSFCFCHKGTSGNMCEIVDDCQADPDFCGKGNSDRCVYDRMLLKADCKCDNEFEKFDFSKKICRNPCDPNNSFCNNGAKCEGSGTSKFCKCQEGTRGDRCEVIDQCKEDPKFCGGKDDVECVYDVLHSQAICKCKEIGKKYDGTDRMCKNPCSYKDACRNGANCEGADADKFCRCMTGTRGDFCEIVDKCREDPGFCGDANDARCVYDPDSVQAICKCHVDGKMFDESLKMCRILCDPYNDFCRNGAKCEGYGTSKFCKCQEGTSGDRCEVIDQCKDDPNFCGEKEDVECVYDVLYSQATCKCKVDGKKYDGSNKMCKIPCDPPNVACKNWATCEGSGTAKFCKCKPGTSGDSCEVVDQCQEDDNFCGEKDDVKCVYDTRTAQAICKCQEEGKMFDQLLKICKTSCGSDADCGEAGTCRSSFCFCKEGYEGEKCEVIKGCKILEEKCRKADAACVFDDAAPEKATCFCKQKEHVYDSDSESCKKLECTEKSCWDGKCDVVEGKEECSCFEGYVLEGDRCLKLNCSRTPCVNGTCIVRRGNVEECVCPSGFTLVEHTCRRGICRIGTCFGGQCQTVDGELVCVCPRGFHLEGVGCYETICKKQNCFGGKCVVKDNVEICTCREGYVLINDVCKEILCEKKSCFGGQCHLVDGREECTCPAGFSIYEDVCRAN